MERERRPPVVFDDDNPEWTEEDFARARPASKVLPPEVVAIAYQKPQVQDEVVSGNIPILDVQFGNVWTNIDRATFERLGVEQGEQFDVRIFNGGQQVFKGWMPYVATFGDVPLGDTLLYLNSIDDVAFAINWGNFAGTYGIASGPEWRVEVTKR